MPATPTAQGTAGPPRVFPPGPWRRTGPPTARALARRFGNESPHAVIAGGQCLVGRGVAQLLAAGGWRVTVVDAPAACPSGRQRSAIPAPASVVWHDLALPLHLDEQVDAVVNLALPRATVDGSAHDVLRAAGGATQHTLDLARRHGSVYVLAASSHVYGGAKQAGRQEDDIGGAYSGGGLAMRQQAARLAEAQAASAARAHALDVRIARLFNAYGPGSGLARDVVSVLLAQALRQEPLTIHRDGSQTRTFLYVDDAADALVRMLQPGLALPGPVNIGGTDAISIIALARLIRRLAASSSKIRRCPEPDGTVRHRHPDITRAARHLAWRPRTSLVEGLTQTVLQERPRDARRAPAGAQPLVDRQAQRA